MKQLEKYLKIRLILANKAKVPHHNAHNFNDYDEKCFDLYIEEIRDEEGVFEGHYDLRTFMPWFEKIKKENPDYPFIAATQIYPQGFKN